MADLNAITGQFAGHIPILSGIYRSAVQPGRTIAAHTAERPTRSAGFVFTVKGSVVFAFNGTEYELARVSSFMAGPIWN